MKIIVIDNDPLVLSMLEKWLCLKGHTVLTYSTPLDCPPYQTTDCPCTATGHCPEIVISDYDMPEANGYDLIKRLHEKGCQCASKCAIITGHELHDLDLDRFAKIGIRLFHKPVSLHELDSWVNQVPVKIGS